MFLKSLFSLALLVFVFSTVETSAAVLTVTTNQDTNDGVCNAHCSLREAVGNAGYKDTIIFDRSLRGTTIELTQTLQVSGNNVTIDGPRERRITLKGNGTFRILNTGGVIFIDDLIIRDGGEPEGEGGGIYVGGGTLLLTNCLITNNTALSGGGIYVRGALYLMESTVLNNTATGPASAGGVYSFRGRTWIINSTISNNHSMSTESGIGGFYAITGPSGGYANIFGSTIAYNSSNGTGIVSAGGLGASGGGGTYIANTIIAKNTGLNPDFYGSAGGKNCLVGISNPNSAVQNGVNGHITGTAENPLDPQIGLLADNGGNIPTHALLNTSPAIDAGDNSSSIDRRGNPQPIDQRGYNRIVNSTVDMGSFEYNAQPVETFLTITGQVKNADGRGISGARVTLRDSKGEIKTVLTNPFGFYNIPNLPFALYTVEAKDKRYSFAAQTFLAEEATEYANFTAK